MKSPFRRRKRVKGRAMGNRPEPAEQETVEWPRDGTGKPTLMGAIRGDGKTGAGFGGGLAEDLASVFEGSKKIKVEEQERQKLLREDDHEQTGSGATRDDLTSGKIRIRRPD
ncbi:hypothetical protein BZB76_5879 [Actinomadura pelletieri DSM 43383]|uniref:Uncharacterized protein n=1 Tax=Actinomadura pelletieri DSM 43383 TaxID=1120940 RepID=A0A495QAP3_9ACTN|nr:DUF6191 domain-containing protein [Actinomadura pelletieri]RKS68752.1 hypothetical protein BZB76_5879 [Actinomadura pelletieri DSM 43383]